jgi:hypothetical protein
MIRLKDTTKVIQGVTINVGSGLDLSEDADGLPHLRVTGASIPNPLVIPPDSNLITIRTDTGDGGDTASMRISGSGDISATRGAYIELHGNEWAGGGPGDMVIGIGVIGVAKLSILGGTVRHQYSSTGGSKFGFWTAADANHIVENAYYNGGFYTIETGKAAIIQTETDSSWSMRVRADNVSRAADAARSFSDVFRVDLTGNSEAVGSASNTGKLKGNRFILPTGTDKWAT